MTVQEVFDKVKSGEMSPSQFEEWFEAESESAYTRGQDNEKERHYM